MYQLFPGQTGTSPPISFPASHDSILSPPVLSGSEDNQEGPTMLTHQVPARQESQEHNEHTDSITGEEENEETSANEQENVGEEGENQLSDGLFSPLASEYDGAPPQRFVFWEYGHTQSPHLLQRTQTGPRAYQGKPMHGTNELYRYDEIDNNTTGSKTSSSCT